MKFICMYILVSSCLFFLIFKGPVAATINASPLRDFTGGQIFDDEDESAMANHVVSIVGWGKDDDGKEFWHVRVSFLCRAKSFLQSGT